LVPGDFITVYALSNAVKDGQLERVEKSPFFSTYA
jgi:hypothetical protein